MKLTFAQNAAFERFGTRITDQLRDAIKTKPISNFGKSPVDASGRLHDSVEFKVTDTGIQILANDYIYYLEYGRKPSENDNAGGPKLYDVILDWIDDKGIVPTDITKESLAFLITRKIHREGTTIYRQHKGQSSGLIETAITNDDILDLSDELSDAMITMMTSEILKDLELSELKISVE